MKRLFGYYRQFEELSPDELSRELRERRDEDPRVQQPPLDLSGAAWHGPPHPEVVNAATFALRRAVNAYPGRLGAARPRSPRRTTSRPSRVVVGHGAGELLRAALRAVAAAEVEIVWPGWGLLPSLVDEAGRDAGARSSDAQRHAHGACSAGPTIPTGAVCLDDRAGRRVADRRRGAGRVPGRRGADPRPPAGDPGPLVLEDPRHGGVPRRLRGRAGGRAGSARRCSASARPRWRARCGRSSSGADSAPPAPRAGRALRASGWRRSSTSSPGEGPYAWLRAPVAEALAARRIYVAPGSAWGDEEHVRVTLSDAAATERLLEALRSL